MKTGKTKTKTVGRPRKVVPVAKKAVPTERLRPDLVQPTIPLANAEALIRKVLEEIGRTPNSVSLARLDSLCDKGTTEASVVTKARMTEEEKGGEIPQIINSIACKVSTLSAHIYELSEALVPISTPVGDVVTVDRETAASSIGSQLANILARLQEMEHNVQDITNCLRI